MTLKQKIFQVLVTEGKQRTAAQLAAQLKTTAGTVVARISELRDEGYTIHSNQRTDKAGRTKTFYRYGAPTRNQIAAGRWALKTFKAARFV